MLGKDKYSHHSSIIWPAWLNGWVFVCELSGCGFESRCIHLTYRYRACLEQGVPWHSSKYRVWIHSETRTWHDKNIKSHIFGKVFFCDTEFKCWYLFFRWRVQYWDQEYNTSNIVFFSISYIICTLALNISLSTMWPIFFEFLIFCQYLSKEKKTYNKFLFISNG